VSGQPYLILSYPLTRWELPESLTAAERDVVRAILEGSTRREIAVARGTSERTVSNLLTRAFTKMDARSKMEIASSLPLPRSK
jgi:DNA-binding CsgD family transcriptional regulator